ncbi:MAG: peptidoglycan DD-metalloendopeptidase family protein [Bacteroidales bacterium]|nr:peptidoglycan DD-metalloendopeptidase family protein [Bacteroidales bacterium]
MMSFKHITLLLCAALLCASPLRGQDRKTLEANKKKLEQEIAQTSKQLNQTQSKKKATTAQLQLLNSNIDKRKKLINGLNQEVALTNREINKLENKITRLSRDVENLRAEYAKLIVSSYRHRNRYSSLMFILSSRDFNQAVRRIRYISQYNEYIRKQVDLINEKQAVLKTSRESLEEERAGKQRLMNDQQREKKKLEQEQKEKNRIVSQLKSQEKTLKKKLSDQQKKVNELNAKIKKLIEEEVRRSQANAQKNGASATANKTAYALTPAEKALSGNFESNKGKLPWPLERGTISGRFGTHPHPMVPSVTVTNNGIDILTEKGASARAVFQGEVASIGSVYGLKFVMVRHGGYISVYANLDQVYVQQGQKVETKQKIGRVYYDREEDKTELQFQLWKGTEKINPEYWIAK